VTFPPCGRPSPIRTVALLAGMLAVLATACGAVHAGAPVRTSTTAPTPTRPPPGTAALEVGPGARPTYVVERQPAPGSCHYRWAGADPLPDPACTPGAVDPHVTPSDMASTICRAGWTATVRPPEDVTGPEKVASAAAYGYTGPFSTAEYDHLVPLELGGDPNDPANLWVEPNDLPDATSTRNGKDALEATLHRLVCAGDLPLATAQRAIASDWVTAAARYG
jgi:hypothetical protein